MQGLLWPAFWVSTACGALMLVALFWSMAVPSLHLWPPPRGNAGWQYWLIWTLIILLIGGDIIVAIVDGSSLGVGPPYDAIGWTLIVVGNTLAWWGVAILGGWTTTGLAGPIVTTGPYQLFRNPQYLGDVMIAVGIILASNSALDIWPSALAALCALVAPFAEEPWLRQRLRPITKTIRTEFHDFSVQFEVSAPTPLKL